MTQAEVSPAWHIKHASDSMLSQSNVLGPSLDNVSP